MVFVFLSGCAARIERPKRYTPSTAMISISPVRDIADDLDMISLNAAVDASIRYYEKAGGRASYCFGNQCHTGTEMTEAMQRFRRIMNSGFSAKEKMDRVNNAFEFYQSIGNDGAGTVVFTGYYEPVLDGSLNRTERFRYPLYKTPEETVTVSLGAFNPKYGNDRLVGRLRGKEVIPHYSRKEIETDRALDGRGLEIAWVDDPVSLFILHIQGSGRIRLPDGSILHTNYAQSNGRPFRGLTRYMVEKGYLAEHEKGYRHMKAYLQEHPETRDEIMNHNESYIFFRVVDKGPIGSLGFPIIAGRSIAVDPDVFPKGALAIIKTRKPIFNENGEIRTWVSYSRFVFSHDAGGAIKGPGRVDLFCGTGPEAERLAGSLKEAGNLFFLAPKR